MRDPNTIIPEEAKAASPSNVAADRLKTDQSNRRGEWTVRSESRTIAKWSFGLGNAFRERSIFFRIQLRGSTE